MNLQPPPHLANPQRRETAAMSWEGDQMLHIYVCDYLRKRGFSQAALALRLEAGLEPERQVPIDAPQSLLFEWWVVFWEVFASRSAEVNGSGAEAGLGADARTYSLSQAGGTGSMMPTNGSRGSVQNVGPSAYPTQAPGPNPPQSALGRRPSQINLTPNERSEASTSTLTKTTSPPSSTQQQQQQQQQNSSATLPQLDLESSKMLGLTRPASRVVIEQCMDMLNMGTQLHGLQPPKALVGSSANAGGGMQQRVFQQDTVGSSAGLHTNGAGGVKRKESPNPGDGAMERSGRVQPAVLRRLSYQAQVQNGMSSAPSPLTPNGGNNMPFSQVSPHPMLQHSPASSAPTPMMNPPVRRPSVLGPEPTSQANSPLSKTGFYASGLPTASPNAGSSVSPLGEWHGQELTQQQLQMQQPVPPLQQQQRPVVLPSSLDHPHHNPHPYALPRSHLQPLHLGQPQSAFSPSPNGANLARPLVSNGIQQLSASMIKPSVFASAPSDNGAGGFNRNTSFNHNSSEGAAPVTPFADLEYDFNVLLSNSTQLNREEASSLVRQLGDVGGS
ncbi:uncharacterized protein UTRI_06129_B [Ustilago trichophora]|uniref:Uncharacterized protein n=1 Tax=Ustilago trichophora TaxID=86804 RepID=A0A5C3EJG3_9BASI|nr:uncharacterized protein UTRI_06129_B [Ustilago trichophora]